MKLDQTDEVQLRAAILKIGEQKLRAVLLENCPARVTPENILKDNADGIARLAAMRAGWEGAIDCLITLALDRRADPPAPEFRDMT